MSPELRDEDYATGMLDATRLAVQFASAVDQAAFHADRIRQLAVIKQIEIIGEAASKVSAEFKSPHPEIAWQSIIGMRHRLVHNYRNIRMEIVWDTATRAIPALIAQLEALITSETTSDNPPEEEDAS